MAKKKHKPEKVTIIDNEKRPRQYAADILEMVKEQVGKAPYNLRLMIICEIRNSLNAYYEKERKNE